MLVALYGVSSAAQEGRLRYVTTARQLGPVAYRDPLGVPSPDGRWLATHVGLHLRVEPLAGGSFRELGELGEGRRRRLHLVWRPDSRTLVAREANRERAWFDWSEYDTVRGPIAFDADGGVFVGRPNDRGTLDLWRLNLHTGGAERISDFTRDTYAPYALADGRPELIHRFASEQWFTGFTVSPDGASVAYIAPASDGHMQLFKVSAAGGEPVQLTTDPSDKTHPSWSPRGDQIAFTVFRYLAHFWLLER